MKFIVHVVAIHTDNARYSYFVQTFDFKFRFLNVDFVYFSNIVGFN